VNFIVPVFNCKSGKNRTGHFDLETKFLASRIKATGHIPKPGELSDQEPEAFSVAAPETSQCNATTPDSVGTRRSTKRCS
jgi:hypothetical protein